MSRVSTHNDELVLYLFKSDADSQLSTLLWHTDFILDDENKSYSDSFPSIDSGYCSFILLEQDDEESAEIRAKDIAANPRAIYNAYINKDYNALRKYIGDDDILWFEYMDFPFSSQSITIEGSSKLDKYRYVLKFLDVK
ncbi:hypothetical protein GYB22_11245 [bacterium]|nr:hypothetical protein [bacterium]